MLKKFANYIIGAITSIDSRTDEEVGKVGISTSLVCWANYYLGWKASVSQPCVFTSRCPSDQMGWPNEKSILIRFWEREIGGNLNLVGSNPGCIKPMT